MTDAIRKIQAYVEFVKSIPEDQWPDQGMDADEELAWLYGREAVGGIHSVSVMNGTDADVAFAVKGGTVVLDIDGGHRTPDEAVDLARALLAAAEEARGHK